MLSFRVFVAFMLHCLTVSASIAGPPVVTYFNVTPQAEQITYGSRGWIVTIGGVTNPGPSGSIIVEAIDPNTPIERITIVPGLHQDFGSAQTITLTVRDRPGTSGTIPYLGTILRSGTFADMWISLVTIDGTFGDPKNLTQDSIVAQSVNQVRAAEIAGTITSLGSVAGGTEVSKTVPPKSALRLRCLRKEPRASGYQR